MDGYGSYQGSYAAATPGGPSTEYTPPPPRPPSQSSAPSAHQGMSYGFYSLTIYAIRFIFTSNDAVHILELIGYICSDFNNERH